MSAATRPAEIPSEEWAAVSDLLLCEVFIGLHYPRKASQFAGVFHQKLKELDKMEQRLKREGQRFSASAEEIVAHMRMPRFAKEALKKRQDREAKARSSLQSRAKKGALKASMGYGECAALYIVIPKVFAAIYDHLEVLHDLGKVRYWAEHFFRLSNLIKTVLIWINGVRTEAIYKASIKDFNRRIRSLMVIAPDEELGRTTKTGYAYFISFSVFMQPIMEAYVDILLQTVKASRRERSKNVEAGRNFDDVDNMLLFPNSLKPEKKATNVTTQFQRTWDVLRLPRCGTTSQFLSEDQDKILGRLHTVRHLITSADGLIDLKNDGEAHVQSSSRTGNRNAQLNSSTPTLRKFYLAESKETFESIEKKIKVGLLCLEKILEEGTNRFLRARN
ncbi:hypothetical protein L596_017305 [Steinernema carpocapsae]|uniref:Uncharacterized protein n=1 Tax=Steinernema carpocapsae TaxID=34508 RepID=A0A4U5N1G2_STECR|nr:hypothetical protein L596_017305 [Steinernema carpocapsae]